MTFYGRTLRGLEDLACKELSERFGAHIHSTGHREIFFSADEPARLTDAGLLDDVFIFCGQIDGIDHTRASLQKLGEGAGEHLASLRRALAMRPGPARSLKVVASFLGRRNYNRYEIEAVVGAAVARKLGMTLFEGREEDADRVLRVHLRDGAALLALRLFERPLRQRPYKKVHYPGATPPQAGRALAMLAELSPGARVLDPYCGTATVLIEAGLLQPSARLHGGDVSTASLIGGGINAAAAGVDISLYRMSALALAFADRSFDRIMANVPWGLQVDHAGQETLAWAELRRVLHPAGRAVVLVHEAHRSYPGFVPESDHQLRIYGQTSWIVTLRPA